MNNNQMKQEIIKQANAKIMDMQIGVDLPTEYFHYTSIASFLNIIESGKLWLSHYNYLNDPNEVSFGIDVLRSLLKQSRIDEIIDDQFLDDLKNLKQIRGGHLFIFSLSQIDDSLSQWMSYGDKGAGVSVSFSRNPLSLIEVPGGKQPKVFFPVLYYDNDSRGSEYYLIQDRLNGFEEKLIAIFDIIYAIINDCEAKQELINLAGDYILLFSSCIKHKFYKDEQEYRFIVKTGADNDYIRTRIDGDSLKVYFETDIKKNFKSLIQKVIIGPKHYRDERVKFGIDNQLRLNGFGGIEVKASDGIMQ